MADHKPLFPDGAPSLDQYYIYLTAGCNLACQHCYISPTYQANGGTGGHLDYNLFEMAIEEGLPLGLGSVKLTGGEPLLHPDFLRMIDFLREKELGLTIESNGTLMTPEIARYLKEKSTLSFISISLDGANAKTHDVFRGVKGSFENACQGIQYLVEVGYHPQVIMSLYADNICEILPLVRLAKELRAGSVKFNLVQPSGRGKTLAKKGKVLTIQRLIEIGKWVEGELQDSSSISLRYSWPMAFYNTKALLNLESYTCSIYHILGLLSNGQLAMCGVGTQMPDLVYGIVGKDRVADVWKSNPLLNELRKGVADNLEGVCGKCLFRGQCLGTCIAENYLLNGNLFAPFWFCREAYEKDIFPLSRLV
jgi:SynChlorMet cassette radical SAM/SPASM protein ScmF